MVTYSSYLGKDVSLPFSAGSVSIMNIFVSLLAGLAIFPVVFSFGLEPAEGPGLLFMVLPQAFAQMPCTNAIRGSVPDLIFAIISVCHFHVGIQHAGDYDSCCHSQKELFTD